VRDNRAVREEDRMDPENMDPENMDPENMDPENMDPENNAPRHTPDQRKKARLADALRANLRRRREQAKHRSAADPRAPEAEKDLPPPHDPSKDSA
jgi:hypothetical protein